MSHIHKYTNEQLEERYNVFIETIKTEFADDSRLDALLHMYSMEEMGPNLIMAPASANDWFHNAYIGGYIDHVLNVLKSCKMMNILFAKMGGTVNYTTEELAFVALHHDLGKLGTKDQPYYVEQTSEWHRKNQGSLFTFNPNVGNKMTVTDRGLLTLNAYDIKYSTEEWLAIKVSDGMYEETNKYYLMSNIPSHKLKTNLPYIIHWADHMASIAEYDMWKKTLNN